MTSETTTRLLSLATGKKSEHANGYIHVDESLNERAFRCIRRGWTLTDPNQVRTTAANECSFQAYHDHYSFILGHFLLASAWKLFANSGRWGRGLTNHRVELNSKDGNDWRQVGVKIEPTILNRWKHTKIQPFITLQHLYLGTKSYTQNTSHHPHFTEKHTGNAEHEPIGGYNVIKKNMRREISNFKMLKTSSGHGFLTKHNI